MGRAGGLFRCSELLDASMRLNLHRIALELLLNSKGIPYVCQGRSLNNACLLSQATGVPWIYQEIVPSVRKFMHARVLRAAWYL